MDNFDMFADFLIFCIVGTWIVFAIALVKKKKCGEILAVFSKKESKTYIALSILWAFIGLLNLWTFRNFSINMKVMNWMIYPTVVIDHIYLGISKIQFRETGVIWNASATRYVDIESYQWEEPDRVVLIIKKGFKKKMKINVLEQNVEEITRYLEEKVTKG